MERDSDRRQRVGAACLCALLVAAPFAFVQYPPITDLPQQLAQMRLFGEAWHGIGDGYRIQWFTPYSISYALLGAAWALCSPENAARAAMAGFAVFWTLAVHLLAARRKRPLAAAIIASALFFNHAVYWGFLSFAIGWVTFILWFLITTSDRFDSSTATQGLMYGGGILLLYMSHALWFAVGLLWLCLYTAVHRPPLRTVALRFASLVPLVIVAVLWYPQLAAAGFVSPTVWAVTPTGRLSFSWLVDAILGGLHGSSEYVVAGVFLAWVFGSLWQERSEVASGVDRDLLLLGVLLGCMGLLLPDQHMNTIEFAARWVPPAAISFVLAMPGPPMSASLRRMAALAFLGVFVLSTTLAWKRFERDELSGLGEALAKLPEAPRVVGLDFVKQSTVIKGRPFLQTFAYAQVLRGGLLNFSFAGFAPSLVVFGEHPPRRPWTQGLEWFPERLQQEDLQHFDVAIINGRKDVHEFFAHHASLQPETRHGRWRLYRIRNGE